MADRRQHDEPVGAIGDDAQALPGNDASEDPDVGCVAGNRLERLLAGAFLEVDADRRIQRQELAQVGGKMLDDRRYAGVPA